MSLAEFGWDLGLQELKQACKEGLGNGTPDNYLKDHRLHGFIETEH